jgi:hypothetical protein
MLDFLAFSSRSPQGAFRDQSVDVALSVLFIGMTILVRHWTSVDAVLKFLRLLGSCVPLAHVLLTPLALFHLARWHGWFLQQMIVVFAVISAKNLHKILKVPFAVWCPPLLTHSARLNCCPRLARPNFRRVFGAAGHLAVFFPPRLLLCASLQAINWVNVRDAAKEFWNVSIPSEISGHAGLAFAWPVACGFSSSVTCLARWLPCFRLRT